MAKAHPPDAVYAALDAAQAILDAVLAAALREALAVERDPAMRRWLRGLIASKQAQPKKGRRRQ